MPLDSMTADAFGKQPDIAARLAELRALFDRQPDLQKLLDDSVSWADARTVAESRSRRVAWRVAAGSGVLALCGLGIAAGAVHSSLQPSPPPQVLVVDRATGQTSPLVQLAAFQAEAPDVSIRRLVTSYVRARENYTFATAEDNYRDAAAFMSPQEQARWVALWDTANPTNPLKVYGKDGTVHVDIGAIVINRDGTNKPITARVNFVKTSRRGDTVVSETAWVATIPFGWVNVPTAERDRRVNDLGFEALDYLVDQDVAASLPKRALQPAPAPPPAPVAPAAPAVLAAPSKGGA